MLCDIDYSIKSIIALFIGTVRCSFTRATGPLVSVCVCHTPVYVTRSSAIAEEPRDALVKTAEQVQLVSDTETYLEMC